jgi:phage tail-like protein
MPRNDPYRNFRFRVEIDGIEQAGFSDATIPDSTTASTDYREGTDPTHQRKLSGLTTYGNVTLKWGLTDSMELYEWRQQVVQSGALDARKNLSLVLIDEAGNDKTRWNIMEAWPTKYDASDFSAKGNDVVIENLELVCEEVIKVQG